MTLKPPPLKASPSEESVEITRKLCDAATDIISFVGHPHDADAELYRFIVSKLFTAYKLGADDVMLKITKKSLSPMGATNEN